MAVVQTEAGPVRGVRDGRSWCWRGVPYAAAPTGDRRFRPPMPPAPWTGVRDATRFGPAAPQPPSWIDRFGAPVTVQDEDCLQLNIWSPAAGERARAVLVWVHGGGFAAGSGILYGGAALAAVGDIVVVTLNYRLGPLGFVDFAAALGDPAIGRNLGLQDIAAALGWIARNIANFGGDPGRVTVAGHTAGAAVVALLLRTPVAALVRGAILQGGSDDCVHAPATAVTVAAQHLAHLGRRPRSVADLQAVPLARLLQAQAAVRRALGGLAAAAPVLDGADRPASLAGTAADPRMPLLVGTSRARRRPWPARLPAPSGVIAWRAVAERHAATGAPTWVCRFDYAPSFRGGVPALPLLFLWPSPGIGAALRRGGFLTDLRSGLSERLRAAWTGFVRDGTPGEDWPAYRLPDRRVRLFDLQDRVVSEGPGDGPSG